ncbi:CsbD family protein [Kushneria aurantia]|uniref:CsbD family protein n=1 Tax=Kushneria aurantia TaxID=504092 RepID=A0ABV6G2S0_9GAMM|nr:CsbD family protein [Kushneria aurantia]
MTDHRMEGEAQNVVGKAQQAYGDFADDKSMRTEGKLRSAAGQVQSQYGEVVDSAREFTVRQPVGALAIAAGVGFILGALMTRR